MWNLGALTDKRKQPKDRPDVVRRTVVAVGRHDTFTGSGAEFMDASPVIVWLVWNWNMWIQIGGA